MLWLSIAPSALDAAGRKPAEHHEVRFAGATTGQANLVAPVASPSTSELHTYLSEKIGGIDGVQAMETALTLRHVKQLTYEPSR